MNGALRPLAAALLLAAACVSCAERDARGIVLITLDTTRADHLGCYGYDQAETPALDAFAAEAVLFEQAQTPVPVTLPAHCSMFTGIYPPGHGVRYNGLFRLAESNVTIAERLRDAGWATAAIPSAFPVTESTGLAQGFDEYMDMFAGDNAKDLPFDAERKAEQVAQMGGDWIARQGDRDFFLWLHVWDAHHPYEPPFPYSTRFRDRPYDGEIAYLDEHLGALFERLKQDGVWDDLLVVVAGDHGEGLYDHGERQHANLVYQSTMRVPLILKPPGRARGRRVSEPVSLVDVAPTVLDYAGLEPLARSDGISLRPAARGKALPRRAVYFESLAGSLNYGWSPLEGVRRGRLKYTRSVDPELYDLDEDPGERTNRYGADSKLAAALDGELGALLDAWSDEEDQTESLENPLSKDEMDRLASLGYAGGSMSTSRGGGPHPASLAHLENVLQNARSQTMVGDHHLALQAYETVLQEDPANRFALWQASRSSLALGWEADSHRFAEILVETYPEFLPGSLILAESWIERGEAERGVTVLREGLEHTPGDDSLTYRLALALVSAGRPAEADEVVDGAIASGADQPSFVVVSALCRALLDRPEEALEALEQAIDAGYALRSVLETEAMLAPLRAVPGFDALLDRIPPEEPSS